MTLFGGLINRPVVYHFFKAQHLITIVTKLIATKTMEITDTMIIIINIFRAEKVEKIFSY